MVELHKLTSGLKHGEIPNPVLVVGIMSDLVKAHEDIGQEMAQRFGAKERAYLHRKLQEAKQYQAGRMDIKKRIADVSNDAMLSVGEEYEKEIERAEEYESYRTFLRSLQNAIDYSRTVISFLKTSEAGV